MKPSTLNKISLEKLNNCVQDDFQTTIQFQFDYIARKAMICTQSNCFRSIGRRSRHESLFSEISDLELNKLQTFDTYHLGNQMYEILSLHVEVTDYQIVKALDILSKRKRDIVLMFYYLEMSDEEIAEELRVNRSTIYRNRTSALGIIKNIGGRVMKKTKKLIPFRIIKAANDGDVVAIQYILELYEGYIAKLSTKVLTDECGNGYYFVDKDIQEQLTSALLQIILKFKI